MGGQIAVAIVTEGGVVGSLPFGFAIVAVFRFSSSSFISFSYSNITHYCSHIALFSSAKYLNARADSFGFAYNKKDKYLCAFMLLLDLDHFPPVRTLFLKKMSMIFSQLLMDLIPGAFHLI